MMDAEEHVILISTPICCVKKKICHRKQRRKPAPLLRVSTFEMFTLFITVCCLLACHRGLVIEGWSEAAQPASTMGPEDLAGPSQVTTVWPWVLDIHPSEQQFPHVQYGDR